MSKVRDKLIEAVGSIELYDIGESALVDILVNRINSLQAELELSRNSYASNKARLDIEVEQLHKERKRLREDPLYGASGEYYFLRENYNLIKKDVVTKFIVRIVGGDISMMENCKDKKSTYNVKLQRVSPEQYELAK